MLRKTITFDGKPSPVIPRTHTLVTRTNVLTLSFEDKSSSDNPSSPSFVPHIGLVAILESNTYVNVL
jgi:hypothetical protein